MQHVSHDISQSFFQQIHTLCDSFPPPRLHFPVVGAGDIAVSLHPSEGPGIE